LASPTVGAGGDVKPIKDLRFPLLLNVDTRGVWDRGDGMGTEGFDNNVIAEGVRVLLKVGDGGKTNKVWDGVPAAVETESVEWLVGIPFGRIRP